MADVGDRAMVAAGMTRVGGEWVMKTKPRTCPICRNDRVTVERDDDQFIVNVCDDCSAIGVISKGKPGSGWWYHDWQMPADMAPNWAATVFGPAQPAAA